MNKIYFYIGSNNATGELESDKAIAIIAEYFEGFTAFEVIGYWKGRQEKTLKVEVVSDEPATKIVKIAKELREKLDQDSILVETVASNCSFIQ